MRRTVKKIVFYAKKVENIQGNLKVADLEPIEYDGRTLTQVGKEKLFIKANSLDKNTKIMIVEEKVKEDVYELDDSIFFKYAKKVEE